MKQVTATRTVFVMAAGGVDITISFLSPVEVIAFLLVLKTFSGSNRVTIALRFRKPVFPFLLLRRLRGGE